MELNDIQKLMQTFNDTGLNRMQYSNGNESLILEKGTTGGHAAVSQPATAVASHDIHTAVQITEAVKQTAAPVIEKATPAADNIIKAPMVGVFYLAPSPDASPYVQIGQSVVKGQTLCILEAMKVLNEIQSEWDGVVDAVLAEPEDVVEYGQPLFRIRRV